MRPLERLLILFSRRDAWDGYIELESAESPGAAHAASPKVSPSYSEAYGHRHRDQHWRQHAQLQRGADPFGRGLSGIRSRVESLGGTFNVTSPSGIGTQVEATLPCSS